LDKEKANIKEKIVTQYVDRIVTVEKKRIVYVKLAADAVPAQCNISMGWINLYNASVLGQDADETKVKDPTPSGLMDNQVLQDVLDNNAACHANIAQIQALQTYSVQLKDLVQRLNSGAKK